jgi:HD-GYP domain-containing protein (c-di-GMP phosphodiesterase class II)
MNEVLANRDLSTYKHTLRVAQIAMAVGREAGLSTEELTVLELGCLVHDIGKTAIPDAVLLKPDLFNDQDRRIMGKISEKLGTLPSIYIKPRSVGWPPKKNGECP